MQEVSRRLSEIRALIPQGVKLVAVSKFHPVEAVREAYDAGQRLFGESRADELAAKAPAMPADVRWHFIGHVQSNKLRRIIAHAHIIQSVDSERLLRLIDAEAARIDREIDVLLQVHVAAEETKTGMTPHELLDVARRCAPALTHTRIKGIMGMATNTDDRERIEADFRTIAATGAELAGIIEGADTVSMGMSSDWPMAVSLGANMIRIGTDIFGMRQY